MSFPYLFLTVVFTVSRTTFHGFCALLLPSSFENTSMPRILHQIIWANLLCQCPDSPPNYMGEPSLSLLGCSPKLYERTFFADLRTQSFRGIQVRDK